MAGTNLGTAWIQIKPSMKGMTSSIRSELSGIGDAGGAEIGSKFSAGFAAKLGVISGITQQVFSTVARTITNQLSDAVYRADTLERFPKVMEMMGYKAEDAAAAIEKLRKGVEEVPTSLADVVSLTQRLTTMTKDVGLASDWALAISDAMLITTGDVNEASRGMTQFLQILAKGKPVGNDWNTILEVASPVMEELARSLGYTSAALEGDFYTALQKGTLSTEEMMAALLDLDKNGSDSMSSLSELARTATGGIQTSMTTMQQSISNAWVSLIQEIGPQNIVAAINVIKEALVGIVKALGTVFTFFKDNWSWIEPILTLLVGTLLPTIGTFIGVKLVASVIALTTALNGMMVAPWFLALSAVVGILILIATHFEDVKNIAENVFATLGEVFQGIWDSVTATFSQLADFFGSIFGAAWERVKAVFSTGGQIFMGIVDGITNAFRTIVNAIITGINHVVAIPFNAINGFLSFLKGIDILGIKPFDWVGTIDVPQIPLLATGGRVFGEGTATSDSIPALLSKGEYVINAATAQEIGYDRLDKLNETGRLDGGQIVNITINGYNKSPEELANIISRKIAFNQRGVIG